MSLMSLERVLVNHEPNTLFLFQLDTLLFFPFYIHNFTIFSTCFGAAGPSSGESNYTAASGPFPSFVAISCVAAGAN